MKRIRESLEYPIPFWLSPIFLLSLIGFWMIFKWGFESTPEKWEYWKWVIEKVIYIGTVIGAAYWAQSIFNKRAQKRENRERRLKHVESMMNDTSKILIVFKKFRNSNSIEIVEECNSDIFELISLLHTSSALYKLDLEDSIQALSVKLSNASHQFLKHANNKWAANGAETPLTHLGSKSIESIMESLKNLKDDILDLHCNIEKDGH